MSIDELTLAHVLIAIAIVAIAVLAAWVSRRRAHARSAELRRQFGPEYDRALEQVGNRARAERALLARARRVHQFRFHELSAGDRRRFEATWARIQAQFVDDPALAVSSANQLISEVMRARGYPTDDFEQRVEDLSVNYPTVVQHYRAAHQLSKSAGHEQVNTEELRQAVVHYRVLFAELLQDSSRHSGVWRGAPA
jgi:FtsZ-interacting cell division protein ZipA